MRYIRQNIFPILFGGVGSVILIIGLNMITHLKTISDVNTTDELYLKVANLYTLIVFIITLFLFISFTTQKVENEVTNKSMIIIKSIEEIRDDFNINLECKSYTNEKYFPEIIKRNSIFNS